MMYDHDDDLDRALRALPLEPLPDGLRASIMAAVAAVPEPILTRVETFGVGLILALGTWLALLSAGSGWSVGKTVANVTSAFGHALVTPAALEWLGVGIACALCLSLVSLPRRATAGR